jgi:hypothetical protein
MPTPGLVHQIGGQHFDPAPQRPGVKRGRNRTRLAGFPASGEQRRVSSHDRRTPTVPLTLRDQAFHPAKRAIPPFCTTVQSCSDGLAVMQIRVICAAGATCGRPGR